MRILVTGAAGQLGQDLVGKLAGTDHHRVIACDRGALDVANRDSCLQVIGSVEPDVVIHTAAWTDVDGCETDPDRAWQVNALGTRHLAEAARLVDARVCYVSTDYVFDGRSDRAYNEWDATSPLSIYGRSKLAGEAALGPGDTIVRTSWVCGLHGRNFVRKVLERASAGQALHVVDDQHGCPTFADDLAGMICWLAVAKLPGVFHVTNQGPTTWYQLARDTVQLAGLDESLVSAITTDQMQPTRPAPRPASSVLDNAALRLSGLPLLDDHHVPLERLVKQLVSQEAAEGAGAGGDRS